MARPKVQDLPTAQETGRSGLVRGARRSAAVVVAVAGGYLALVSAAFAGWSDTPAGAGRVWDGAAALVVSALMGLATAAAALAVAGSRVTRMWLAVGLAPAAWGVLNAARPW